MAPITTTNTPVAGPSSAVREKEGGRAMTSKASEAVVFELAKQDVVPWYRKPNLRMLYLIFLPTCIGVEMTSG